MITEKEYLELKYKYRGTYKKANEKVIPHILYKILNYNEMIKSIENFKNFENFINFYLESNKKLKYNINYMVNQLNKIGIKDANEQMAKELLIVRLGNVYKGIKMEIDILEALRKLAPHIVCKKSTDVEDMEYKIDATLEIPGVNRIAIQIKPESYKRYSSKSETPFHQKYFYHYGNFVVYLFYDNEYNININNKIINISDKEKLISIVEKLILEGVE